MQLGPQPPSNTPSTESQTGAQSDAASNPQQPMTSEEATNSEQESMLQSEQPQTINNGVTEQINEGSSGESFFQTWMKGQENPIGPSMLFLLGIMIALFVLMRALRRSSSKRKLQTHTMGQPSERIEKLNRQAHISMDPAQRVVVEAEDLTRRMGAVLDNKAAKIEILLQEANERIAQLERASKAQLEQAQSNQSLQNRAPDSRGVPPEALDRARLDQDRAERFADPAETTSTEDQPPYRFERGPMERSANHPEQPSRPAKEMTFPEQVDELAVQGLNAMEIANKLNRPVGEVELVLNLRRNSG